MVIPDVGLLVTPIRPTILEDTVTKKNAQTTIKNAPTILSRNVSTVLMICGERAINIAISKAPPKTYFMLRSISVLFSVNSSLPIRFFI